MTKKLFIIVLLTFSFILDSNAEGKLTSLKHEGDSCFHTGKYTKAFNIWNQWKTDCDKRKLFTYEEFQDTLWEVLKNMGTAYSNTGQYGKAKEVFDSIFTSPLLDLVMKNDTTVWKTYYERANNVYFYTGQYQEIINDLEPIHFNNYTSEIERKILLASTYGYLGQWDKATPYLDSLIQTRCNGIDSLYEVALHNRAFIAWEQNQLDTARAYFNRSIPLTTNGSDRALSLGNLATVEAEMGDIDSAQNHINECLSWSRTNLGETHPDYLIALRKSATINLMRGDKADAQKEFEEYFKKEKNEILQTFPYFTAEQRINYWNSHKNSIASCYALETDGSFLYDVALFSKSALNLSEQIFNKNIKADVKASKQYAELEDIQYQLLKATGAERKKLEARAITLNSQLKAKYPSQKTLTNDINFTTAQVAAKLSGKNDCAVEFIQYVDVKKVCRYAALLLKKSGNVEFIPLFTDDEIRNYVLENGSTLGKATESSVMDDKNRIYTDSTLAEKIWRPILSHISKSGNIYFSPDGIFHILAIESMMPKDENHPCYRLSSTAQLAKAKNASNPKSSMLIVGGLNYDAKGDALTTGHTANRRASEMINRAFGNVLFVNLPQTRVEADSISKRMKAYHPLLLTGDSASELAVKENIKGKAMAHFATHGYCLKVSTGNQFDIEHSAFNEDQDLNSCGLAMSGANNTVKATADKNQDDNVISGREFCDLDLSNMDIAVLSACQTGLSENITLSGMATLPRALKKAGVNTIIASLWEVDDQATMLLMDHFYQHLANGEGKQKAFSNAIEELKHETHETWKRVYNPGTKSGKMEPGDSETYDKEPQYWAAFIMIDGI